MNAAARLCALAAILAMAVAVPAHATVWGHTTVWDDATALEDPSGGATPVFDTGDPTTASWGPTEYTSFPSQTGADASPTLYYLGQNADGSTWTDDGSRGLDLTHSLVAPTETDKATVFADATAALSVDRNARYSSGVEATPTTTGDWVFVLVASMEYSGSGSDNALSWDPGSPSWRGRIDVNSSGDVAFGYRRSTLANGSVACHGYAATGSRGGKLVMTVIHSAALGRVRGYCNGVYEEDDVGSVVGDGATAVFDFARAPADTSGDFDLIALYESDVCDTADECNTAAAEHFARLSSSYLDTGGVPSTSTRASTAYLRKCDPTGNAITYHLVGDNWPRREVSCGYTWADPTSSETTVASFLQEASVADGTDYNVDISNADWTLTRATVSGTDPGPLGLDCHGLIASTDNNTHIISNNTTRTAADDTFGAIFKDGPATQDWLRIFTNTGGTYISVDMATCSLGTAATATNGGCQDLGNDYCFCWGNYSAGSAGGSSVGLLAAEADNDNSFAGDGSTVHAYVCHMMYQQGLGVPTSPVLTVDTTDVTRSAETLQWALSSTVQPPLTLTSDLLWRPAQGGSPTYLLIVSADASPSNNFAGLYQQPSTLQLRAGVNGSATDTISANTQTANARFIGRLLVSADTGTDHVVYEDGVSAATSTPLATQIPADIAYVAPHNATLAYGSSQYRLRLFGGYIAPGEQGTGDDVP